MKKPDLRYFVKRVEYPEQNRVEWHVINNLKSELVAVVQTADAAYFIRDSFNHVRPKD